MLMSFDTVDAVTVDRLNGMIDGGTPQDPMGDVAISFMALSAFDGMYIEVGSRLLIDAGSSSVDWSYTTGFGIEEMASNMSLQGTFSRTGTFEVSFDSSNARGSATFHVVDPVGGDVTYNGKTDNIRSFEYEGYYTESRIVCTTVGQYTEIDLFVGSSDGSASTDDADAPLAIGENGLLYGTPAETGTFRYKMLETDDAYYFDCTVFVFDEYSYSLDVDNGDGVGGLESFGYRGFTDGCAINHVIDDSTPTLEGSDFVIYVDEKGMSYGQYASDCVTIEAGVPFKLTAVYERTYAPLAFLSNPSEGMVTYAGV